MKLIVECKRKKCVPPIEKWEGKFGDTLRAKIVQCALCKSLKVKSS